MPSLRLLGVVVVAALLHFKLSTCRSPGEGGKGPEGGQEAGGVVDLPGVDTSALTSREKHDWSGAVSELLAPCPEHPVTLAQCVKEARACKACVPAAEFLTKQVRRGKTRSQIDAAYRKRFAADQVKQIDLTGSPARGPGGAPVTIVEFADFECPGCGQAYPVIERLFKRFPTQIRFVFKNFPLSTHKFAEKAARAAVAAGKQGKFWEMHHKLFELQDQEVKPEDAVIERLARQLGLDMKRFDEDLASEAVADLVDRDRKQGEKLELKSTPLIYINGRHFDLEHFELGDIEDWIRLEIELATGKKVEPGPVSDDQPAPSGKPEVAPPSAAPSASAPFQAKAGAAPKGS
jgi:protein-disulfide isomerase